MVELRWHNCERTASSWSTEKLSAEWTGQRYTPGFDLIEWRLCADHLWKDLYVKSVTSTWMSSGFVKFDGIDWLVSIVDFSCWIGICFEAVDFDWYFRRFSDQEFCGWRTAVSMSKFLTNFVFFVSKFIFLIIFFLISDQRHWLFNYIFFHWFGDWALNFNFVFL